MLRMTLSCPYDNLEMPYTEGNVFEVILAEPQERRIQVKVLKVYSPFTPSCVMQVRVPGWATGSTSDSSQAVLKMYDRRFAHQLRQDKKVGAWSPEREMAYHEFANSGEVVHFVRKLYEDDDDDSSSELGEEFNDAQNEAFLHDWCSDFYKAEVHTYSRLQQLQSREIPKLYQKVILRVPQAPDHAVAKYEEEFLHIKGILIEFIDGVTFSDLSTSSQIPRMFWQSIVDQAIGIVHKISDHEIRNEDVRPANIMVTSTVKEGESQYRVVMLDFASCKFRESSESDKEWGRDKWSQDEEGAVGQVMRMRMRKVGFDLRHEGSLRFLEFAPGEDSS